MVAAAVIGGTSLIGTAVSASAGSKAAKAQKQAADQSDTTNRYIYDTTRADQTPGRIVGESALYKLADLYGVSRPTTPMAAGTGVAGQYAGASGEPVATTAGYSGFETSPGYQFRVDEATKAIERSAAARGNLRSGATMDALQRRVQNVASDEFDKFADRLASLAGVGQSANAASAQAGQAYASQQTATNMAAGQARASAYANTGNAINQGVSNLASAYLYSSGYGGSGGFSGGATFGGGSMGNPPYVLSNAYAGMRG
jgi:hypothetical protein